jgi:photosystem II stability/assembly factor-like uncharacterized protein
MNLAVLCAVAALAWSVTQAFASSGVSHAAPAAPVASAPIELRPVALYGGDIRSVVFDPVEPERAFAGSSAGHVYRSDDGGTSWRNAGPEAPFAGWVVGTLVFDPETPHRLWAGMWGIWGGGLVAYSDDLAATWTIQKLGDFSSEQVYALARVPGTAGRLFAGTRGGVIVSDDLGATWKPSGRGLPGLIHVSSLFVDPLIPQRVIAGTWRRAFRSDDGGASWRGIFEGMVLDTEVFTLNPVPGRPGELWASSCGWVYRGEAWGERWSRRQAGLTERRTPAFRVVSSERLLAGTVAGSFLSTDGGQSFRRTSRADLSVLAIAHHPARPERILLGTEGSGVWVSNDGGESFVGRPVGMRNVRVAALARSGDQVFAALAHAGPSSGVFRSPDGGISFEPTPWELPTVLDLAFAGKSLFAATEGGLYERVESTWRRVAETGTRRIEALAVADGKLLVRTGGVDFVAEPGDSGWRWFKGEASPASAAGADANAPRRFDTGDPRFERLSAGAGSVVLFDRELGVEKTVATPFPPEEMLSALVTGNRLLVGTSGYGLWEAELPE